MAKAQGGEPQEPPVETGMDVAGQGPPEDAAPPVQPEPPAADGEVDADAAVTISQWEFIDRIPTREEVVALLETLPPVWGVRTVDFADYVQGLPANKKVDKYVERNGSRVKTEERHDVVTLYMGVAGRIKMIEKAAEINGWAVDFEPEPITPTGAPGLIQNGDGRIVYREYAVVRQVYGTPGRPIPLGQDVSERGTLEPMAIPTVLGRKAGMAWVPYSGGKQAAGSNPYEKVETAARGRSIAAWGFGVLPGSGVASLEEMLGAGQNRAALEAEASSAGGNGGTPRKSRDELIADVLSAQEELRQNVGDDEFVMRAKTGKFLTETLGVKGAWDEGKGEIDWSKVKDGQIQLLLNSMNDTLRKMRAGEFGA